MRKSFLLFLFIGISLFISCESQEDIFKTQENVSSVYKTTINNYLTKIKIVAASNIENTKKINTLIKSIDYNNLRLYDFQSPKKMLVVNLKNSPDFSGEVQSKIIFFLLNEEIIGSRLVTINNNSSASFNDTTIISSFNKDTYISGYSGTITFFNLFQRMLLSNQYTNGDLVTSKAIEKNTNSMMSKSVLCIEWYLVTTYQDGFQTKEYQYTTCDSCSLDEIFESLCNSDGGTGGSGGIDASQEIEDQIDDSKLDPCPKGVLNKLKNTTVCDMANVLTKLGANSIYNVKIESGNSVKPATTIPVAPNEYKIILSNDRYTSSTDLFKAANILHEVIHAFFMSLVDDYTISQNPSVFNEFPILFQKFVDTKYPGSKDDAHHEEIANSYVEAIGSALQEFQTGIALPYGVKPNQIYTDLAWGGLKEAPIYDKHFSNKPQEKLRIENRYASEQTGHSVGDGTPQAQTPLGKPCK
jgi:hypothetical protein